MCKIEGCDKPPGAARGLCTKHYKEFLAAKSSPCSVDGCEDPGISRTWCNRHYLLWRKHGTPTPEGARRQERIVDLDDGRRVCTACKTAKPLDEFHRDARGKGGRRGQCRSCRGEHVADWYASNREIRKAKVRAYRAANVGQVRARDSRRYHRDKAKRIELVAAHVHVRRARIRAGLWEPGVTVRALRLVHGDSCCYCGRVMDFEPGTREVYNLKRASIEHKIPVSKGGGHTWANTTLACLECNITRGNRGD